MMRLDVQRASQCESVAPIAAYYTRYAGMMKGLDFKSNLHPDIQSVLLAMMSKLEQDKKKMGLATSAESDTAKKAEEEEELRAFALKVFAIADRTDQMGARDAKLLNKYMSARTFMQAYETILEDRKLPAKEAELLKYCSVRCYQISKALKAGVSQHNCNCQAFESVGTSRGTHQYPVVVMVSLLRMQMHIPCYLFQSPTVQTPCLCTKCPCTKKLLPI